MTDEKGLVTTSLHERLGDLKAEAQQLIEQAETLKELADIRVKYLGRKGELTQVLRSMSQIPAQQRPAIGQEANELREYLESLIRAREQHLESVELEKRLKAETLDITLPGTRIPSGKKHVLQQVLEEIQEAFAGMGYSVVEGPEVETDWYNFVALNIPKAHPARDMQATFYITEEILLRTHTSPVQIRAMRARAPQLPVRVIVPGRVYRRDPADASHSPVFTQVEGLALDHDISFGDLKGTLLEFAKQLFGPKTRVRFRPSYFPFTEPSAEVDVSCTMCGGEGCRVCGGSGWLEVLGSGMVHPRVIENGGYDPETVQGFAFGMGVERIAMLKYGIDDIRLFYTNDLRFLTQF